MATKSELTVMLDCAKSAVAANHHDTDPLTNGIARALYIGVSGNVKVTMADGAVATFVGVPVGILPIRVRQVFDTLTTATSILALY